MDLASAAGTFVGKNGTCFFFFFFLKCTIVQPDASILKVH